MADYGPSPLVPVFKSQRLLQLYDLSLISHQTLLAPFLADRFASRPESPAPIAGPTDERTNDNHLPAGGILSDDRMSPVRRRRMVSRQ